MRNTSERMHYNSMMESTQYFAPCKLNLFLHITGRLANGYHQLQTVFLLLNYGDTLTITPRADGHIVHDNPLAGVPAAQDLTVRAALALRQSTGCLMGATIHCEKRIPLGGGLGGGSSDAATTLLALNQLWQLGLNQQQLMQIGGQLGADVPFFIFGQTAWAEGVGDQLTAFELPTSMQSLYYVVLTPLIQVPTAQIFADEALTRNTKPLKMLDFSGGANVDECWLSAHNDMEAVVKKHYPAVANTIAWLSQFGHARMSGSGASVFVAVTHEVQAQQILQQKPENTSGFVAKGLKYHPFFEQA